MDNKPHIVHPIECHEDPTLWNTPGSQRLHHASTVMLPWWLLMAIPPHYS
jgi:hypothetical protein